MQMEGLTLDTIAAIVCLHYGMQLNVLKLGRGNAREREARHYLLWLSTRFTDCSTLEISRYVYAKPSTVLRSLVYVENLYKLNGDTTDACILELRCEDVLAGTKAPPAVLRKARGRKAGSTLKSPPKNKAAESVHAPIIWDWTPQVKRHEEPPYIFFVPPDCRSG